jgi:uncharacterized tellurite resistance protein B-like protein
MLVPPPSFRSPTAGPEGNAMEVQHAKPFFDTEDQIRLHLGLLRRVAEAEGEMSSAGRRFMERKILFYEDMFPDVDIRQLSKSLRGDLSGIARCIAGRMAKMILLQDLVAMAYSDGSLSDAEKAILFDVGADFGLAVESVEDLISMNEEVVDSNRRLSEYIYTGEI